MKTAYIAKHAPFHATRLDMTRAWVVLTGLTVLAVAGAGGFGYLLYLAG